MTPDQITSEIALLQGRDMLRSVASSCNLVGNSSHLLAFLHPMSPAMKAEYNLQMATTSLARLSTYALRKQLT